MSGLRARATGWEQQYRERIASRRFEEARALLASVDADSAAERRKVAHLHARILIHEEKFEEALSALQTVRTELGDHVQLQTDIASCHFVLGRAIEFQTSLERLQLTLSLVHERLGAESAIVTAATQAQFLEERGEVMGALAAYEALIERYRTELTDPEAAFVYSQMIRINVRAGETRGLIRLDQSLREVAPGGHAAPVMDRSKPGAFLLALELRGVEAAVSQFHEWIGGHGGAPLELRRLALYEGLEFILLRGHEMPEELLVIAEKMTGRTAIEDQIHRIATAGIREVELELPTQFTERAGIGATLRMLSLLFATEPSGIVRLLLKDQFIGLSDTLSLASQTLWEKRLEMVGVEEPLDLILQRDERIAYFMDRSLDLTTKEAFWNLLQALAFSPDHSLALRDAVQTVWPGQGTESDVFRVTSVVSRLNRSLLRFAGRGKAILTRGGRILLAPGVQLFID